MYALINNGIIVDGNTWDDDDPARQGEWWPNDTVIHAANARGGRGASGPLRIAGPDWQAPDWPARAARQWDGNAWVSTGGQTGETDLEKAIRLLRDNPLPSLPDVTVPELPASPSGAQVIDQVRTHQVIIQRMADEVVKHRRYVEGYRKILLRLLRLIDRRRLHG